MSRCHTEQLDHLLPLLYARVTPVCPLCASHTAYAYLREKLARRSIFQKQYCIHPLCLAKVTLRVYTSRHMASKPTVVLVAGSCHTAQHFVELKTHLQTAGYRVCCSQLASVDSMDPTACHMSKDIAAIQQQVLQPLVDRGCTVLLVCHSAAGYAGGAAALGYSRTERSVAGKEGGIVGVIFIAAFLAYKGAATISKSPDGSWHRDFAVDVSIQRFTVQ